MKPLLTLPTYQAIPLSPDDSLLIDVISSTTPVTIILEGTAINIDGALVPFHFELLVPTALTPTQLIALLGYQFLLSVTAFTRTASIPDGSCFIRLLLVQRLTSGVYPHRKLLAQGYISTFASIGYGSSSINGTDSDHHYLENISIANPAAGAGFSFLCPDYTELKILHLNFTLTTDATVANRFVDFTVQLPPGANSSCRTPTAHTAGLSCFYSLAPLSPQQGNPSLAKLIATITLTEMQSACQFIISVLNIQAGDQFSNISLLVLRKTIPFLM